VTGSLGQVAGKLDDGLRMLSIAPGLKNSAIQALYFIYKKLLAGFLKA